MFPLQDESRRPSRLPVVTGSIIALNVLSISGFPDSVGMAVPVARQASARLPASQDGFPPSLLPFGRRAGDEGCGGCDWSRAVNRRRPHPRPSPARERGTRNFAAVAQGVGSRAERDVPLFPPIEVPVRADSCPVRANLSPVRSFRIPCPLASP